MRSSASAPTELPRLRRREGAPGLLRRTVVLDRASILEIGRENEEGEQDEEQGAWCGPITPRPTQKRRRKKRRSEDIWSVEKGQDAARSTLSRRLTKEEVVARSRALRAVAAQAETARKASAFAGSFAHRSARPAVLNESGRPLLQRRFAVLPSQKERYWNSVTSLTTSAYDERYEREEVEAADEREWKGKEKEEWELEEEEVEEEWRDGEEMHKKEEEEGSEGSEGEKESATSHASEISLRNKRVTFYDERSERRRRAPIPFYLFYTDWRRTAPAEKVDLSPWRSGDDDVYKLASINAKLGGNTSKGRRKGVLRNRLQEKTLRDLSLHGCSSVTDGAIIEIGESCRSLRSIDLSGCVRITNHGIIKMRAKASHLEEIILASQDEITDDGIRAIAKGCLHLRRIELYDLQRISDISMHVLSTRSKRESDLSVVVVKVGQVWSFD